MIRERFDMRIHVEDRLRLRFLAERAGRSESEMVRQLVREAASRQHLLANGFVSTMVEYGDEPPGEAA